jgi:hypothetical protein
VVPLDPSGRSEMRVTVMPATAEYGRLTGQSRAAFEERPRAEESLGARWPDLRLDM